MLEQYICFHIRRFELPTFSFSVVSYIIRFFENQIDAKVTVIIFFTHTHTPNISQLNIYTYRYKIVCMDCSRCRTVCHLIMHR